MYGIARTFIQVNIENCNINREKNMKITKSSELKSLIMHAIREYSSAHFPFIINFSQGMEHPEYKITIEEVEQEFFIDSKGTRWQKVKENPGGCDKEFPQ